MENAEFRLSDGLKQRISMLVVESPQPGVLAITLNRPGKLNALSKALLGELRAVLDEATASAAVHCVVLTGVGKAFSAGADIQDMTDRGLESYLDPERLDHWRAIEGFPKPLIGAINGLALGGGCELAMLCDVLLASEAARFGQPEINIGALPGDGGTQRLVRQIGKSWAMRIILSGEVIDAATAERVGMITEVVPAAKLMDSALALATRIASKPPLSLVLAKRAVLEAFEKPLSEGLDLEREAVVKAFATEDRAEGMRAFVEKRPPIFRGR